MMGVEVPPGRAPHVPTSRHPGRTWGHHEVEEGWAHSGSRGLAGMSGAQIRSREPVPAYPQESLQVHCWLNFNRHFPP